MANNSRTIVIAAVILGVALVMSAWLLAQAQIVSTYVAADAQFCSNPPDDGSCVVPEPSGLAPLVGID